MGKLLYLFGKELNEHLEKQSIVERYLTLRLERFREEFLSHDIESTELVYLMETIEEYLLEVCEDEIQLHNSVYNLRQSIFWLQEYTCGK